MQEFLEPSSFFLFLFFSQGNHPTGLFLRFPCLFAGPRSRLLTRLLSTLLFVFFGSTNPTPIERLWLIQPTNPDTANTMSNTLRGTPSRPQGRGALPFTGSPGGSNIPRPVGEHTSELGGVSAVSASRQKQTKRDEVGYLASSPTLGTFAAG